MFLFSFLLIMIIFERLLPPYFSTMGKLLRRERKEEERINYLRKEREGGRK